jgi:hypothetical protein
MNLMVKNRPKEIGPRQLHAILKRKGITRCFLVLSTLPGFCILDIRPLLLRSAVDLLNS